MQITQLGPNHVTVCAACGKLISNQIEGPRKGLDELRNQLKMHIDLKPVCKKYYDSLPTWEDVRGILKNKTPDAGASE